MSDLQDVYLHHRASGLIHEQAVEQIALNAGISMGSVLAQLEHQDGLDQGDGIAPGNWKRPRHRQLAKIARRSQNDDIDGLTGPPSTVTTHSASSSERPLGLVPDALGPERGTS